MGCRSGVQGLAAVERQAPVKEATWPGEHRRPWGREGTHPGRSSRVRNAVTRRGPAVLAGKPTVRRAQLLGGNRMTEKRMPVAERQRETMGVGPAPQLVVMDNRPDTGPRGPARKSADAVR